MSTYSDIVAEIQSRASLLDLHAVRTAFGERLYLPDPVVVDVTLAGYVHNRMLGDPLWIVLIGASGRGKTEVISSLGDLPDVHALSALTGQTFASGMKGRADASLLRRLERDGKTFITLKDMTTVLTMHRDARAEVFAQLREIYDGAYRKEFGTGESVAWEGRLGFLAGVTPAIDQHHSATALLGERFLYLRLPDVPRREISARALSAVGSEREMRAELRAIVGRFLTGLEITDVAVSLRGLEELGAIADLTTLVRSAVSRDGYSREINAIPEAEAPTRFAKQLAGLIRALMVLGRSEEESLATARRVAADSVPPTRLAVIRELVEDGWKDTGSIGVGVRLPTTTTRRVLEDLEALGLVDREKQGDGRADRWRIGEHGLEQWLEAGL